jgi:hypothetical protein
MAIHHQADGHGSEATRRDPHIRPEVALYEQNPHLNTRDYLSPL